MNPALSGPEAYVPHHAAFLIPKAAWMSLMLGTNSRNALGNLSTVLRHMGTYRNRKTAIQSREKLEAKQKHQLKEEGKGEPRMAR